MEPSTLEIIVLKIGGSVITQKAKNKLEVKKARVKKIAKEIKSAKKHRNFSMVIVHGVGSFGHKIVKAYRLEKGIKTKKQWKGLIQARNSIQHLNEEIVKIFQKEELLVFPINTSSFVIQKNQRIIKFESRLVKELFKIDPNIIPILHGDVTIDLHLKAAPLSADYIAPLLAKKINAKRVLLGGDVDGLFNINPKLNKNAKLIRKINDKNIRETLCYATESVSVDVTGGMKGKLTKLKENLSDTPAVIFNLDRNENLFKLLTGKKINCTELHLKSKK